MTDKRPLDLIIRPASVTGGLVWVAVLLTLAHVAGQISRLFLGRPDLHGLVELFNMNGEGNAPALFSAGLLLAAAILLMVISKAARQGKAKYAWHWAGLGLVFVFLSVDEALAIHERLNAPLQSYITMVGSSHFAWVLPYAFFLVLLGVLYLDFLLNIPGRTSARMCWAGVIFLTGAVGMEVLGSARLELFGGADFPFAASVALEEMLEMLGVIVLIHALLDYMSTQSLRVNVTDREVIEPERAVSVAKPPYAIPHKYQPVFAQSQSLETASTTLAQLQRAKSSVKA